VALNDQLIADIIARVRERATATPDDLRTVELELRTKWGAKHSYASKVVRHALERARQTNAGTAIAKRARPR
jgi:hypothetical protein